jgi:hypothetical protein
MASRSIGRTARTALTGLSAEIAARRRVVRVSKPGDQLGLKALFDSRCMVAPFNLVSDLLNPADLEEMPADQLYGLLVLAILQNPPVSVVEAIDKAIKDGTLDRLLHDRGISLTTGEHEPSSSPRTRPQPSSGSGLPAYAFENDKLRPINNDEVARLEGLGYTEKILTADGHTGRVFTPPARAPRQPSTRSSSGNSASPRTSATRSTPPSTTGASSKATRSARRKR